jgi:phage antirepressor YoqD-like protein
MNIEIQQIDNDLYVDSRIVAKGFEIEHWNLCETLKKHFPRLKRIKSESTGGRPQEYYLLTKRDSMILPVVCKTTQRTIEFQTRLVDAFLDMEEQLLSQHKTPQTYLEALKECTRLEEERLYLEEKMLEYDAKIKEDAPKVRFHDSIAASKDCITVGDMAKLLGTGRNRFFDWLRDRKILRRNNQPYQEFLERDYFDVKEDTLKNGKLYIQTLITPKGQVWLSNKYN